MSGVWCREMGALLAELEEGLNSTAFVREWHAEDGAERAAWRVRLVQPGLRTAAQVVEAFGVLQGVVTVTSSHIFSSTMQQMSTQPNMVALSSSLLCFGRSIPFNNLAHEFGTQKRARWLARVGAIARGNPFSTYLLLLETAITWRGVTMRFREMRRPWMERVRESRSLSTTISLLQQLEGVMEFGAMSAAWRDPEGSLSGDSSLDGFSSADSLSSGASHFAQLSGHLYRGPNHNMNSNQNPNPNSSNSSNSNSSTVGGTRRRPGSPLGQVPERRVRASRPATAAAGAGAETDDTGASAGSSRAPSETSMFPASGSDGSGNLSDDDGESDDREGDDRESGAGGSYAARESSGGTAAAVDTRGLAASLINLPPSTSGRSMRAVWLEQCACARSDAAVARAIQFFHHHIREEFLSTYHTSFGRSAFIEGLRFHICHPPRLLDLCVRRLCAEPELIRWDLIGAESDVGELLVAAGARETNAGIERVPGILRTAIERIQQSGEFMLNPQLADAVILMGEAISIVEANAASSDEPE